MSDSPTDPGNENPVEPESARALWQDVREVVARFVVFQRSEDLDAVALWVLHTWAIAATETTLYLWVSSPQPECGKSRLLDVLKLLAANAEILVIPTAPSIFRLLDAAESGRLTLLLDEVDKVYGYGRDRSELTGVIDQGNRRSGRVPRNVGTNLNMAVKMFPVFCPKALAGIEKHRELLPDTVRTRSVLIRLHKRGDKPIDWFFAEEAKQETAELRDRLEAWAEAVVPRLRDARPMLPEDSLTDRQLESWRPMFAIADLAGAEFGEQMRQAATVLHYRDDQDDELDRDLRLIRDGCEAFEKHQVDQLLTERLIEELVARDDEDSPWRDMWGSWRAVSYDTNGPKSIGKRIARML